MPIYEGKFIEQSNGKVGANKVFMEKRHFMLYDNVYVRYKRILHTKSGYERGLKMNKLSKDYLRYTFFIMIICWGICLLCSLNGTSLNDNYLLYCFYH